MTEIDPASLLIGVVAHSSRLGMAEALVHQTQAQVLNVDQTCTTDKDLKYIACANNHLTVLRRLQAKVMGPTWCIILEDDAWPIKDFRVHAAAALQYAPSQLVGFYVGRAGNVEAMRLAYSLHRAWALADHMVSAVAYAVRSEMLDVLVANYTILHEPTATPEQRITRWMRTNRLWFSYTVPSLVDHSDGESLIFAENNSLDMRRIRRAWMLGVAPNWNTDTHQY